MVIKCAGGKEIRKSVKFMQNRSKEVVKNARRERRRERGRVHAFPSSLIGFLPLCQYFHPRSGSEECCCKGVRCENWGALRVRGFPFNIVNFVPFQSCRRD